ncbi:glycosyltransferase [Flavobacterium sp.]|uniref:glycosyltransferase family 2 protein n=1 Tax=Flavobacterium sp. TaxID=239 RepID=UPI0025BECF67|nr:glycosyltransferase [Flavobacterium sp.]
MVAIAALFLVYILVYGGFIVALVRAFPKVKSFEPTNSQPTTTFSIIIPFRTEEKNLHALLDSISKIEYPHELFELIFVDDASEDFSTNVINKWRMANGLFQTTLLENIRLTGSPKKDAISRAVPIVKSDWIITTDADCILPSTWLRTLNDYILQNNAEMIAGPVAYSGKKTVLHHFQRLDFLSLQGTTIGSFGMRKPFMCNGANFAYKKSFFYDIGAFNGNENMASGDDVFLLQKAVKQFPEKVHYLKSRSAIVTTQPVKSWFELLNQRVRWASKATAYDNLFADDLAIVVFLANLFLVISVILTATTFLDWKLPLGLFVLKLIPDWLLISKSNSFFGKGRFVFPVFAALVYPFFTVAVVGFALIGKYRWKGRSFSR